MNFIGNISGKPYIQFVRISYCKKMRVKEKSWATYYSSVRRSEKGQMVLPKEYRDEMHLNAGSPIAVLKIGNGLLLLPEMEKYNALCSSIESVLLKNDLTADDLLETLDEIRDQPFEEVYPNASRNNL